MGLFVSGKMITGWTHNKQQVMDDKVWEWELICEDIVMGGDDESVLDIGEK